MLSCSFATSRKAATECVTVSIAVNASRSERESPVRDGWEFLEVSSECGREIRERRRFLIVQRRDRRRIAGSERSPCSSGQVELLGRDA